MAMRASNHLCRFPLALAAAAISLAGLAACGDQRAGEVMMDRADAGPSEGATSSSKALPEPRAGEDELAELDSSSPASDESSEPPASDESSEPEARAKSGPSPSELEGSPAGASIGEFELTYYVVAREGDSPAADDARVALRDRSCDPIAEVSKDFARDLRMQGTGVLRDGRVVSAARRCDCDPGGVCFFVPEEQGRWGIGAANRSLSPFRSVAVDSDVIALGQTLYLPELDGLTMPGRPPWGGFVHDGCVVADDRGGGVSGKQLDFFAARRGYYRALLRAHGLTSVTAHEGGDRCEALRQGKRPES